MTLMTSQIVTLFGGSGFVARAIVQDLARRGYTIRIASRTPQKCYALKIAGAPGQIVPQVYDPARPETIGAAIAGSTFVVNCVGILYERGRSTFRAAHVELARQIATGCKLNGVDRLVHISALGIENSRSRYAASKREGEAAVRGIFPGAIILRPAVIFGPDDRFFNLFAGLSAFSPVLPLIGGGQTRFQPVYVGDVAAAVIEVLTRPASPGSDPRGQTYELGGPEVLTFRQILALVLKITGRRRWLCPLPWGLAKFQARILQLLPKPILTVDQVVSLQSDSVVSGSTPTFSDLGLSPRAAESILPAYLSSSVEKNRA